MNLPTIILKQNGVNNEGRNILSNPLHGSNSVTLSTMVAKGS